MSILQRREKRTLPRHKTFQSRGRTSRSIKPPSGTRSSEFPCSINQRNSRRAWMKIIPVVSVERKDTTDTVKSHRRGDRGSRESRSLDTIRSETREGRATRISTLRSQVPSFCTIVESSPLRDRARGETRARAQRRSWCIMKEGLQHSSLLSPTFRGETCPWLRTFHWIWFFE